MTAHLSVIYSTQTLINNDILSRHLNDAWHQQVLSLIGMSYLVISASNGINLDDIPKNNRYPGVTNFTSVTRCLVWHQSKWTQWKGHGRLKWFSVLYCASQHTLIKDHCSPLDWFANALDSLKFTIYASHEEAAQRFKARTTPGTSEIVCPLLND